MEEALAVLKRLPFEDMGFAKVDHHRALRCGFPEVVYCEGKQTEQVLAIIGRRLAGGGNLLATRVSTDLAAAVRRRFRNARYNAIARTITIRQPKRPSQGHEIGPAGNRSHTGGGPAGANYVAIVCAGTSDMPVAEEARETCEIMDQPTRHFYDVGVAGIHRLLAHLGELADAVAIVVCAGMEGALPSVVGGLVSAPVIAVPTSVGYGAHLQGLAPLLTMLNSCAAGVSVVNIDNGFGAGYMAALIGRAVARGGDARASDARAAEVSAHVGEPRTSVRAASRRKHAPRSPRSPRHAARSAKNP
ncbi:MAG: nickel pincer cofactor biosynthesis protein LarB [Planctomycetes bacterium]|nr:nickel pincer cofactor biosynthesis protein LarB [Planctomycetota bacterium]